MFYKEWLTGWLEDYVLPTSKLRTYRHYRRMAELHILPALGEMQIEDITPLILQRYVTELTKSGNLNTGGGLSTNSINSIICVLQGSLKTAYMLGITSEYHGSKIKRPRGEEHQIECFSLDEQKKIEEYIKEEKGGKHFGVLLCLYTGLRIGELLALEWSDIDFIKGELQVKKSCYYGKDKNEKYRRIIETPKTRSSVRTIPLSKQLLPYLKAEKKKSLSTYIVSNGSQPIAIRSYQRSFSTLLKKLKITHRGFHSLRHTFATRALECGMDVKTLSEILGHKSPTVTLNRYAHSLMEHKREMMNRLGRLL